MTEEVSVIAGGIKYQGWEKVIVTAGLNQEACGFEIATTEIIESLRSPFDVWNFPPGTAISVHASGGDLMCSGLVDTYAPSAGPEYHSVVIMGRGTSGILVDASPYHATGLFEEKTVLQIISALAAPYDVPIGVFHAAEAASAMVPIFQLRRGETVWEEASRLVGDYAATLMGQRDGSLAIARASPIRHAGAISQLDMPNSIPIKEMSAVITDVARFSDYSVIYQTSRGVEDFNLFSEGVAKDPGVKRFRFKEVIAATEMDQKRATLRAKWAASRGAGESTRATLVVPGWRDAGGSIWHAGHLVFVVSPFLKLAGDMLIVNATFSQDNNAGTVTTLTLMDPRAFGGSASAQSDSDELWDLYDQFSQ